MSIDSNKYIDVFEELDQIQSQTKLRRFSLSLPEIDQDTIDQELANINELLYPSPTPPPSPQITYDKSSIILQIPDEDNFYLDPFPIDSSESEDETPISDIQSTLHFSKDDLLISSYNDKTLYKKPSRKSSDARKIWKQAKIPKASVIHDIESLLLDWAFTHSFLEIEDKKIKSIIWRSKSNCRCQSTWPAFLKWILCASLG